MTNIVKSPAAVVNIIVQIEAGDDSETTMLLQSHPIIAISPLGFRHYNNNICSAIFDVMAADIRRFDVLPFWLSLFLSRLVSVTAPAHSN